MAQSPLQVSWFLVRTPEVPLPLAHGRQRHQHHLQRFSRPCFLSLPLVLVRAVPVCRHTRRPLHLRLLQLQENRSCTFKGVWILSGCFVFFHWFCLGNLPGCRVSLLQRMHILRSALPFAPWWPQWGRYWCPLACPAWPSTWAPRCASCPTSLPSSVWRIWWWSHAVWWEHRRTWISR